MLIDHQIFIRKLDLLLFPTSNPTYITYELTMQFSSTIISKDETYSSSSFSIYSSYIQIYQSDYNIPHHAKPKSLIIIIVYC